jgi:hypothetical protein
MPAWLRLSAAAALLANAVPAAAQGSAGQPALDYGRIVSAVQDCLDSYKGPRIDPKQLKKKGWAKARLAGMGGLEQVMTSFVRSDGAVMLVMQTSCIVKTRLAAPDSAQGLSAAMTGRLGGEPAPGTEGKLIWRLTGRQIELNPGPADGSNVSVVITAVLEGP